VLAVEHCGGDIIEIKIKKAKSGGADGEIIIAEKLWVDIYVGSPFSYT
jgi:hypothetical protein